MDEGPVAGSQYGAGEGPAEASPAASTTHDVDMLEGSMPSKDDTGEAEAEEELQSPNASTTHDVDMLEASMPDTGNTEADEEVQSFDIFAPGSTRDGYEAIIVQITYTYGVRILTAPHVSAYIGLLGEAVRQDNRLALCQAFGRLQTILLRSEILPLPMSWMKSTKRWSRAPFSIMEWKSLVRQKVRLSWGTWEGPWLKAEEKACVKHMQH